MFALVPQRFKAVVSGEKIAGKTTERGGFCTNPKLSVLSIYHQIFNGCSKLRTIGSLCAELIATPAQSGSQLSVFKGEQSEQDRHGCRVEDV